MSSISEFSKRFSELQQLFRSDRRLLVLFVVIVAGGVVSALLTMFFVASAVTYFYRSMQEGVFASTVYVPKTMMEQVGYFALGRPVPKMLVNLPLTVGDRWYIIVSFTLTALFAALGRRYLPKTTAIAEMLLGYMLIGVGFTVELSNNIGGNLLFALAGMVLLSDSIERLMQAIDLDKRFKMFENYLRSLGDRFGAL